jgi:hypothetical protein
LEENCLESMLYILSICTDKLTKKTVKLLIYEEMISFLMKILENEKSTNQLYTLRVLGNICSTTNENTQKVLDQGLLNYLKKFIKHSNKHIRKDTVWIISNLCVGTQYQIESVISEDIYMLLKELISNDIFDIKKEAIWAVCNLCNNNNPYYAEILIEQGILDSLLSFLQNPNNKFVLIALEALTSYLELDLAFSLNESLEQKENNNIFSRFLIPMGFLNVLTRLSYHENNMISEKATGLLDNYFVLNVDCEDGASMLIY